MLCIWCVWAAVRGLKCNHRTGVTASNLCTPSLFYFVCVCVFLIRCCESTLCTLETNESSSRTRWFCGPLTSWTKDKDWRKWRPAGFTVALIELCLSYIFALNISLFAAFSTRASYIRGSKGEISHNCNFCLIKDNKSSSSGEIKERTEQETRFIWDKLSCTTAETKKSCFFFVLLIGLSEFCFICFIRNKSSLYLAIAEFWPVSPEKPPRGEIRSRSINQSETS